MALDLENVQKTLVSEGLDGWLLYDFHGSNPIAVNIAGLAGKHMTRRWYYFIPQRRASQLVHASSRSCSTGPRRQVDRRPAAAGRRRPRFCGITDHAVARPVRYPLPVVDAGTVDFIRRLGMAWCPQEIWSDDSKQRGMLPKSPRIDIREVSRIGSRVCGRAVAGDPVHESKSSSDGGLVPRAACGRLCADCGRPGKRREPALCPDQGVIPADPAERAAAA
jgi:hypothetical protein